MFRYTWVNVAVCVAVGTLMVGYSAPGSHQSWERRAYAAESLTGPRGVARPNILVITADDMRADDLRWMPHVRHELAARGLSFRDSFTPNPLCCPARATFLTGRYSHNHRVLDVVPPYAFGSFDDSTTLATVLRRSGYRTALVGKYLNEYGAQPTFRGHKPSLHYVPPGWTQWWGSTEHRWARGHGPGGGTYHYSHLTSNVNGQIRTWPGRYTTGVTAGQTQDLVRRFGHAAPHHPWFIWWTPVAPHHGVPLEPDDPGTTVNSSGDAMFWQTPARPDWVRHRFDRVITHGAGTPPNVPAEPNVSDKPAYLRNQPSLNRQEKRAERTVTRQRAEALFVLDNRIGAVLAELRRSGQAARTIVVFNSDNGYYLGEHRKRQGKVTLHEPSIRVPMIVAGPGIPHGLRYDPASMTDLAVTVAAWAGARLPRADGTSLRHTITYGDGGWRRPIVIEGRMSESRYTHGTFAHGIMRGLNTVGIRTGRYAFMRYSTGETELYDLLEDPLEMNSLKGSRAQALRQELMVAWKHYVTCAGTTCRAALPADLRTSTSLTARIAKSQERARRDFYQY
jgi:N-acetylglucosamine-6-sulfatase